MGLDVGTVRIGVARSDPHGILATPVRTVARGDGDLDELAAIVADADAIEVVVGLPIGLSGAHTASTEDASEFARRLASATPVPVRMVDERMSTVSATGQLREAGRNQKASRSVIDQVAAVIILQHALDFERSSATLPGIIVDPDGRT